MAIFFLLKNVYNFIFNLIILEIKNLIQSITINFYSNLKILRMNNQSTTIHFKR